MVKYNPFTNRWCIGVIYYTEGMNRTQRLAPPEVDVDPVGCNALNYSFTGYTRACLFWDKHEKSWSGNGCKVFVFSSFCPLCPRDCMDVFVITFSTLNSSFSRLF